MDFSGRLTPADWTDLLRFARVLTGDRGTAEDVVQDVLERLLARPDLLDGVADPRAYIRRMVVNQYLSWGRKWFRVRPVVFDRLAPETDVDPSEVAADRDELRRLLAALPRNQRTVLVMRYYLALSDDSIAELLGCTESTVRSHASRALAALRLTTAIPESQG